MKHIRQNHSKADHMASLFGVSRNHQLKDLYSKLIKRYPRFVIDIVNDLLQIDGYSDIEIAFGAEVPLDVVRKILACNLIAIDREYFLSLLGLYARVFCCHS